MNKKLIKKLVAFSLSAAIVLSPASIAFADGVDIKGDVNKNGKLDSLDALMILKHVAQITVLNDEQLTFADFNSNGKVDTLDALRVLKRVAGIIPPTINEKDYQATSEFILREENAYKYINFSNLINNEYFLLTLGSCNDDMLYNISAAKELLDKTSTLEQFVSKDDFNKTIDNIKNLATKLDQLYAKCIELGADDYDPDNGKVTEADIIKDELKPEMEKLKPIFENILAQLKSINNKAQSLIEEDSKFAVYYKNFKLNFDKFTTEAKPDIQQNTIIALVELISSNYHSVTSALNADTIPAKSKQYIVSNNAQIRNITNSVPSLKYAIDLNVLQQFMEKSISTMDQLQIFINGKYANEDEMYKAFDKVIFELRQCSDSFIRTAMMLEPFFPKI